MEGAKGGWGWWRWVDRVACMGGRVRGVQICVCVKVCVCVCVCRCVSVRRHVVGARGRESRAGGAAGRERRRASLVTRFLSEGCHAPRTAGQTFGTVLVFKWLSNS